MPWLRTAESEGAREQGSKTARASVLWRFAVPKVLRMDIHATDEDLSLETPGNKAHGCGTELLWRGWRKAHQVRVTVMVFQPSPGGK